MAPPVTHCGPLTPGPSPARGEGGAELRRAHPDLWLLSGPLDAGGPQCQAGGAGQLVIVANLRTPVVMPATSRLDVEPQATVLWFLSAVQTSEMFVNLVDQHFRQSGRAKRMLRLPFRSRCIKRHRRAISLAA
jgi:hypothetical protein